MSGRVWLLCLMLPAGLCFGQQAPKLEPTYRNVPYGVHERNVLDFWQAKSPAATPLVVYIHGGGFRGGNKESLNGRTLTELLNAGISMAAIHYRLVPVDPLPAAHHDARRALQFLRSKAKEWNIDKTRVGAFGGSAGAQLCMYLAFHDDMADLRDADPIARESTRLAYVATTGGQTTMDSGWWLKNIPAYTEPHRPAAEYFGEISPDKQSKVIRDISALSLITADDPPIHMSYAMAPNDPVPEDAQRATGWKVHHVAFGIELKKKMDALGIEADLRYPGGKSTYGSVAEFLTAKFGRSRSSRL